MARDYDGRPSPCACCKYLRRKCTNDCILAPYFPPEDFQNFENVHTVYGVGNIIKILREIDVSQREEAVQSLVYDASKRVQDPIYGVPGEIAALQHRLKELRKELVGAKQELSNYIGPSALEPTYPQNQMSPPPPAQPQQQQHMDGGSEPSVLMQQHMLPQVGNPIGQEYLMKQQYSQQQPSMLSSYEQQHLLEAQRSSSVGEQQPDMLSTYEQQQQFLLSQQIQQQFIQQQHQFIKQQQHQNQFMQQPHQQNQFFPEEQQQGQPFFQQQQLLEKQPQYQPVQKQQMQDPFSLISGFEPGGSIIGTGFAPDNPSQITGVATDFSPSLALGTSGDNFFQITDVGPHLAPSLDLGINVDNPFQFTGVAADLSPSFPLGFGTNDDIPFQIQQPIEHQHLESNTQLLLQPQHLDSQHQQQKYGNEDGRSYGPSL